MRSWSANKSLYLIVIGACILGIAVFYFINGALQRGKYDVKNDTLGVYGSLVNCIDSRETNLCLRSEAFYYLKKFSLAQILDTLINFENNNTTMRGYLGCHAFTHFLGQEAYRKEKSIQSVYKSCTMVCGGGCYHGAVEGYAKENPQMISEFGNVEKNSFATLCARNEDYETRGAYFQCLHGIGHALMEMNENDVPKSLTLCDTIRDPDVFYCYSGVFMENAVSTMSVHPTRFLKADDPLYPCNALEEKYKKTCYTFQSSYFLKKTNGDWKANAELCRLVPLPYRYDCFGMIGANQVYASQDAKQMKKNCDLISEDAFRNECVKGVVSALGGRYAGKSSALMENFCVLVDAGYQESCYRQAGKVLSAWIQKDQKVESVCDVFSDKKIYDWCIQGISD